MARDATISTQYFFIYFLPLSRCMSPNKSGEQIILEPRKGTFPFDRSVNCFKVQRIIEIVFLNLTLALDIHVVYYQKIFINAGCFEEVQPGWRPDTRSTGKGGSGYAMSAHSFNIRNFPSIMLPEYSRGILRCSYLYVKLQMRQRYLPVIINLCDLRPHFAALMSNEL